MPVTKTILIIGSNLSRRIPNIFTCWGSSLFIEFVENQNTLTLNTDLLKQAAQFNFEISYDYTNGGNILKETIL